MGVMFSKAVLVVVAIGAMGCIGKTIGFEEGETARFDVAIDPSFDRDATEKIVAGIDEWQTRLPLEFHVRIGDCTSGDICIQQSTSAEISRECDSQYAVQCTTDKRKILLNPYTGYDVQKEFTHEIGHSIGLWHISAGNLMAAWESEQPAHVACGDIQAWYALQRRPTPAGACENL